MASNLAKRSPAEQFRHVTIRYAERTLEPAFRVVLRAFPHAEDAGPSSVPTGSGVEPLFRKRGVHEERESGAARVLSIDGGGIRGVIPAIVLKRLEELTGRPTSDMFDLLAGTSTGGIIALALTVPSSEGGGARYSAADLVELYESKGPDIFSASGWHKLAALGNLMDEKYGAQGPERCWATTSATRC
jgi:hypothetical protein